MNAREPVHAIAGTLPAAIEGQATDILLGPPAEIPVRFEAMCVANEPLRAALQRLRGDFERAARLLDESPEDAPAGGPTPPAPALPQTIGAYRIVRQIGSGAFGVVFLAEQQEPIRREVALKLLHAMAFSPVTVARFQNERETLARMNHPAVARIFDAGIDEHGRPWFAMEHVPGQPLHHCLASRSADFAARIELFLGTCEGVSHAHQRGVIHRDLKPHNILVAEIDGRWQPKVIDFGLAKIIEGEVANAVATQDGAVLGTPAYMSPEQVRGDVHDVDTRTDVYALGVILYELLAGSLPFAPERYRSIGLGDRHRTVSESDPPLASVRAEAARMPWARQLRGDLDWILRKAMARHAAERYASVADLAADLRRHMAHEPVTAGPPSTSYVLRKFLRRHRAAVVAAALVGGSLLLGTLVSTALYHDAKAHAAKAQSRLEDFWRLADVVELDELVSMAALLWPSSPERLTDHEHWLERARTLVHRRADHAQTVRSLQALLDDPAAASLPADEARGARFLLDRLQKHAAALDAFAGRNGVRDEVEGRVQFARTVQRRSIDDHRAAWERTIATVAASPRYGGLQLRPIRGLVPLGTDPTSGLEEFAHLQSGRVPPRDDEGRLRIEDDTAIVLVLIPGGDVTVGSQDEDPASANHDPWRQMIEFDLVRTRCEPFLIGKHELTQGQVLTLGVPLHAHGRAGKDSLDAVPFTLRHPEESLLPPVVADWLPHFELRMPAALEWEVAARAGSGRVWGFGDEIESLQGRANVADATLAATGQVAGADPRIHDGFLSHAPVGSFAPNAFGLHDMLGNVAELTVAEAESGGVVFFARGGSYLLAPREARIGAARHVMPNQTTPELGVRVARDLRPE